MRIPTRKLRHHLAALATAAALTTGLTVATPGCAGSRAQDVAADLLLPPSQEESLGEQMEREVEQQMVVLDDPEVQAYIDRLGHELVAASAGSIPDGIDFEFTVIDDDSTINAFTIPGGHIYVYTGLIKAVDSEAELVAVLGHEIAHVTERHIAKQLATQLGLQTLASLALGNNPGMIAQLVTQLAGTGYMLKYSREAEREADRVGIATVVNAGYDPNGYVTFFSKLAQMQSGGSSPDFLQTHPDPEERVRNARTAISAMSSVPSRRDSADFLRVSNQL